ncbi:hypothetical protein DU508_18610 [Pedobacter chinensis]|uniref:Uncharacterized protein n=1 Tax=Pedobacter chinensis TaxID=2282421 RepID=A0A369PS72_9SPHI|nr:hypothetical protein DU508_18610 [Pedobacter chinensis]
MFYYFTEWTSSNQVMCIRSFKTNAAISPQNNAAGWYETATPIRKSYLNKEWLIFCLAALATQNNSAVKLFQSVKWPKERT